MCFLYLRFYVCDVSQQLRPSSHRSHNSFNANSLNFGLLKNFLAVMKKEVNFEKAKNLAYFTKFKLISDFITKPHLGLTSLIRVFTYASSVKTSLNVL